ncbi:MAG: hypothetical protein H6959_08390 [Chromatiaceae bacterium]|nr:hypothetical protein [Gammaproteobacteria bacterium]MCP5422926.1 hypothetical protein [Chromatiaceae bacterium]
MTRKSPIRHLTAGVLLPLALATALLAGGCGFQPRGQIDGSLPSPLHIAGLSPYSTLHRELTQQLEAVHGTLSTSADSAAATLHIVRRDSEARVLSVDSRNKASEYELEESARIRVTRGSIAGSEGDEETVRVMRIQFRPSAGVLSGERESELLRRDMVRELAQKILARVAARN